MTAPRTEFPTLREIIDQQLNSMNQGLDDDDPRNVLMLQRLDEFMDERLEEMGISVDSQLPAWMAVVGSRKGKQHSLRWCGAFDWLEIISKCCHAYVVSIAYRLCDDTWKVETLPMDTNRGRWTWPHCPDDDDIVLIWEVIRDVDVADEEQQEQRANILNYYDEDDDTPLIASTVAAPAPPEPPTEPLPV
jgi:hypothetical protein